VPPSVFVLYELTKLPAALLRDKLADGSINPKLSRGRATQASGLPAFVWVTPLKRVSIRKLFS
jgi:hypothetical protein